MSKRVLFFFFFLVLYGCGPKNTPVWLKGNIHTHTLWSDGDAPPETVVSWYKQNGYQFLALSDHNILSEDEKWIPVVDKEDPSRWPPPFSIEKLDKLKKEFGDDWPELRYVGDTLQMRLKTLKELKDYFEVPGKFLLIPAEEITDAFEKKPVHINATNIQFLIHPQGGKSVLDVMQRNLDAIAHQRQETDQPILAHVNHPNFGWGIVAEDLMQLTGDPFFEVYNGHPGVKNWGDDAHPGTDRMWDIILANRLQANKSLFYGVATDDSHTYYKFGDKESNTGRGWVMVQSSVLTPSSIIQAMEKGMFYSSTGVVINDVKLSNNNLSIHIQADDNISYTTQFIGTLKGFDSTVTPIVHNNENPSHIAHSYSQEIGQILHETLDNPAHFSIPSNVLYVRAKIISSRKHPNPFSRGDVEMAWTQPLSRAAIIRQ